MGTSHRPCRRSITSSVMGALKRGLAPRARGWVEFLLGTPVVLWVGWPILKKFWLSLAHRSLNMYTLIGLGVGLAYLFSLAAVFVPDVFPPEFREHGAVGTYFEAAAVIVTLVILGDLLQVRAMGQTSQAIPVERGPGDGVGTVRGAGICWQSTAAAGVTYPTKRRVPVAEDG